MSFQVHNTFELTTKDACSWKWTEGVLCADEIHFTAVDDNLLDWN